MKKLLLLFMACATTFAVQAQLQTPQPSPLGKLVQKVGLTDVTIEYSRPGVKGRKIFGGLVPYGEMWRTGANKNTMVTFSTDATVDGQTLKAGSYAIFTKPGEESWDVYFYSDTNNWGVPQKWDESKVAAKTTVKAYPIPFSVETFAMDIGQISNNGGQLELIWDKTYVGVPFTVPTDNVVLKSINNVMSGPSVNDYYSAAVYYLQENKDMTTAMEWIDKAVEMTKEDPQFWILRQQSLIHAKAGDKKGAIAAAKSSLELAEKKGAKGYVKMNTDSLKEWGAL
ncbi:DUF2911 domain-containing protein [Hyunsoonleella sp. SJ7]|uniref:DUF2911 domain-containing protein n=1 Tax=Hyunsoonleella aquatilis TaxID=2762758 RepID=A0A923KKJ1_9FLAO|nr:DUF2911 domain-containing protein [Hyunsoonleella aquatilis]MBC3758557.1 DUF2911 domain-containing protein [Hyunsoonleella aquatilis]